MLMVGGGMFTHNIAAIHHALAAIPSLIADMLVGLIVGGVSLMLQLLVQKMRLNEKMKKA